MLWDLRAPLKVEYCGSIQPYLLASMASSLSLCLPLAWQGRRSPREPHFTVVYAPSVEEPPATGDGLATHPSASAIAHPYSCPWHLPSSLGRIWGEKPRVPSPGSSAARSHAGLGTAPAAAPRPVLGGSGPPGVPPSRSQPFGAPSATGTAELQAGTFSSVRGFGIPCTLGRSDSTSGMLWRWYNGFKLNSTPSIPAWDPLLMDL